jgi:hypothetical protein
MSNQPADAIDLNQLANVTGGNSYGQSCAEGAAVGAVHGVIGGPKGVAVGAGLGCLGYMAANAIKRNW